MDYNKLCNDNVLKVNNEEVRRVEKLNTELKSTLMPGGAPQRYKNCCGNKGAETSSRSS